MTSLPVNVVTCLEVSLGRGKTYDAVGGRGLKSSVVEFPQGLLGTPRDTGAIVTIKRENINKN